MHHCPLLDLLTVCLIVLQNLTCLQFGILLQVVQLHDGLDRGATMFGNRIERLTLFNLVEARLLRIAGCRSCCCQFHIFIVGFNAAATNTT